MKKTKKLHILSLIALLTAGFSYGAAEEYFNGSDIIIEITL